MLKSEIVQKAQSILFNTEMVEAIYKNVKTQTRRIVKPQPAGGELKLAEAGIVKFRKHYEVGDYLYVRETYAKTDTAYVFKANDTLSENTSDPNIKWKPSIHMPKAVARLFLQITDVHVERLQNIITGDYRTLVNINHEGVFSPCCGCSHINEDCKDFISGNSCDLITAWINLWNSTISPSEKSLYSWHSNPWVYVYEFKRVSVE